MNAGFGRQLAKRVLRNGLGVAGRRLPIAGDNRPRVLCYHGVCADPPDEWSVTPRQLAAQMRHLAGSAHPVPLDDIVAWHLGERELPARSVAVTFDDGFVDLVETAAPILAEHAIPATVFVASGLAGGDPPDRTYVASRPLMNWSQVGELAAAGWQVGSHSIDHPTLNQHTDEEVLRQYVVSRETLEDRLGGPVTVLAYPYGTASTVSDRDRAVAATAGYRAAFMDMTGVMPRRPQAPPGTTWALPRSKVLGSDAMVTFRASLRGGMDAWRFVERRNGGG